MSAQNPPSVILFPSINYNPAFFGSASGGSFLEYPIAQGTETLQIINVNGQSNFNDNVYINNNPTTKSLIFHDATTSTNASLTNTSSYLTLTGAVPLSTDNSNKVATTQWVQLAPKMASGLTVQLNNTAVNPYSFPMISGTIAGNYTPISISNNLSFVPSTATLNLNGTISANLFRTNANGTIRIYDTGGVSFNQLSQTGNRFVNTLPNTGEFIISCNGQGALPGASPVTGTSILWNATNGAGESDFLNYQGTGSTGGFNFYNVTSSTTNIRIATITKTQPPTNDNSLNLATTAWVQSVVASVAVPKMTYFLPTPMNPSGSLTNAFAIINNVPQSAFAQVSGVIPPSYKFRVSFNLYSTDYLIAYSFCGEIDIYPSRLTNTNPVVAGDTTFTTGNITTNNLTNGIAGLSTSYNYTNATYSPYNRFYWTSCQNGGFFSGGSTTWLYIYAQWSSAVSGTSNIFLNYVIPGYNATPTALNPTNGFSLSQTAMFNYTTEFLGTNITGGTVQLF